ncbi:MAG: terminase family protein [Thermoplasmata archaeon]
MTTKARRWTTEDEEILRQLYLGRQPLGRIAKRFDTTKDNIRQKAHRLGLRRPRPKGAPRDDIATRLKVLLGEEGRAPTERRLFDDEELLRFAGRGVDPQAVHDALAPTLEPFVIDPLPRPRDGEGVDAWARLHGLDAFCREVVGLTLMDHQLAMALCCLASRRALCLAGRQCGKDVTQAALALWEAVTQPGSRIVLVSGAQRQSDALMEKALGFVARDEKLFDSVLHSSREALELTNGSFLKALPATGIIRGETATRVLVNEARDILNEEEVYAAVEPMLLTTDGPFGIFSTPLGKQGRLWEAFNGGHYRKTRIPSSASRYATPEHLERQRLEMSAARFANEYLAEFLDVESSFFDPESIARCVRDYDLHMVREEGVGYVLGIDWARVRDSSVMMVVGQREGGGLQVAYMRAFLGTPMPDQVAWVEHLHATFSFRRIVSEYAGLGIGPTDQLQKTMASRVEPFKPTAERKALGYDALKRVLEREEILLPAEPKLLAELRTLSFRVTPSGTMTIHGPSDDYSDALMLAVWAFRRHDEPAAPGLLHVTPALGETPRGAVHDPQRRLQSIRRSRRRAKTCHRCGGEIEGSPGVDREGTYHPPPAGCPE